MTSVNEEDYWYDHRDELNEGDIFITQWGRKVALDRRVPGDGANWYVASYDISGWYYGDEVIHPSDLKTRVMSHYG